MRSGRACDLQRQRSKGERVVQRPPGQQRRPTSDQRTWHQHGQFTNKTKRHTPTQQTKGLEPKWQRVTLREADPLGTGPFHPFLGAVTSDTLRSVAKELRMEDDEGCFSSGQQRGPSALSCRASHDPWKEKLRFVIWEAVLDSEIAQEVISDPGVYETHTLTCPTLPRMMAADSPDRQSVSRAAPCPKAWLQVLLADSSGILVDLTSSWRAPESATSHSQTIVCAKNVRNVQHTTMPSDAQIKGSDPLHTQSAIMQADWPVFRRTGPDRTTFVPLRT